MIITPEQLDYKNRIKGIKFMWVRGNQLEFDPILLAAIWLFTTIAAYRFIRKRNVIRNKEFMQRSYVCGLAFVFIRILPEINDITGIFDFIEDDVMRRTVYEWICWVYPLMMVEFWLVWRKQLLEA